MDEELRHNLTHLNLYGIPLDCRADFTKSDWLCWTASMASSRKVFEKIIGTMWKAYNDSADTEEIAEMMDLLGV
jgi:hypothetical protein